MPIFDILFYDLKLKFNDKERDNKKRNWLRFCFLFWKKAIDRFNPRWRIVVTSPYESSIEQYTTISS